MNKNMTQSCSGLLLILFFAQWNSGQKLFDGSARIPDRQKETPVSAVLVHGRISHITQKQVIDTLRDGVKTYGESKHGIKISEVGTHSICSGAAMAMYLGGLPVYAIQLIGWWSSDSFMKYLRKQIEEFTLGVSTKMLTMQVFWHVPSHALTNPEETEYGLTALLMLGGYNNGGRHLLLPKGTGGGETIF
jgi:hypothetical protein